MYLVIRAALAASSWVVDTMCRNVNRTWCMTLNICTVSKSQLFGVPACVPVTRDLNGTFNGLNWTCVKPVTTVFEKNRFPRVGLKHLKRFFLFLRVNEVWLFLLSANE